MGVRRTRSSRLSQLWCLLTECIDNLSSGSTAASGATHRNLAIPLEAYSELADLGAVNDEFIRVGLDLGAAAIAGALSAANIDATEVDMIMSTSVTGIAAPSLDARLVPGLGLREDAKRVPVFGLGYLAGAAAVVMVGENRAARMWITWRRVAPTAFGYAPTASGPWPGTLATAVFALFFLLVLSRLSTSSSEATCLASLLTTTSTTLSPARLTPFSSRKTRAHSYGHTFRLRRAA